MSATRDRSVGACWFFSGAAAREMTRDLRKAGILPADEPVEVVVSARNYACGDRGLSGDLVDTWVAGEQRKAVLR